MGTDESFIGTINLIRLHSFYYDEETGWYYTGSRYYDSNKNEFLKGAVKLQPPSLNDVLKNKESVITPFADVQLIMQIQNCQTTRLNDNNFGKPITYSSSWYNNLSDIELLSRLLYGENTFNAGDQYAVAWVLINRKNANSSEFGGSTYKGVATKSGAFEPITGGENGTENARVPNTSSNQWNTAVWSACTLMYTSSTSDYNSLIPKAPGISNQLFFVGLPYFLSGTISQDKTPSGTGLRYKMGSNYINIKNVVIVFDTTTSFQNPSKKDAILSHSNLDNSAKRLRHNIFFNLDN
ncbi:cell wall hydrolase [Paenibacillus pinihumi]|uniref:cell wall hydrolase n=1 Tax=Paenibacillus pinihumi TaxID=669462 RepID=UPI00042A8564|nr:cell wall hydrolase [Paenibacillus pinihumi]